MHQYREKQHNATYCCIIFAYFLWTNTFSTISTHRIPLYTNILGVVGCSESQFISSKMKPLKMNFFITFFFSLCTGPGLRSLKLNLDAHWQLNHFDSLHTKQESKLTLVFPCSISGSTTENTIKCGNVSTGENIRKVHETKVSEFSSPYQNSRH